MTEHRPLNYAENEVARRYYHGFFNVIDDRPDDKNLKGLSKKEWHALLNHVSGDHRAEHRDT